MSDTYIKKFYNEVCDNLEGNYKIILQPNRALSEDWIEYDKVAWEMEQPIKDLVNNLVNDNTYTLEEKIIKVYEHICLNYVYDANVLFFFRKDTSNPDNVRYIAVDWYGRIVEPEWFNKRQTHNRRICYEFSRFYAKAINTLIDGCKDIESKQDLEAFMLGDKENTHYVVGLSGKDYSVILDQDDFNSIKDLTRLKLGLTIKGIHILRDETGKFKKVVDDFNEGRPDELPEIENAKELINTRSGIIEYFNNIIDIINQHNIDPQGFFEYLRAIIEEQGFKVEKLWKEDTKNIEKRYERCLYFEYENEIYLLDSIDKTLNKIHLEDLDKQTFICKPEEHEYSYYGG